MRNLSEIKRLRKKYGLTQNELAEKAGVSQSLIAKIEAESLDPTFTKAKQIFEALQVVEEKKELKAKDVMHQKVLFCQASDKVVDVVKIMKRHSISQIPVLQQEKVVGIITENTILRQLADHTDKISVLQAREIMEDVPPIVSPTMSLSVLIELLKEYQSVLVMEKGELQGIISKADLLGRIG